VARAVRERGHETVARGAVAHGCESATVAQQRWAMGSELAGAEARRARLRWSARARARTAWHGYERGCGGVLRRGRGRHGEEVVLSILARMARVRAVD
jgi:hypothetical protein